MPDRQPHLHDRRRLREHQAALARLALRLMRSAPRATPQLSWQALETAPEWLARPEPELRQLQMQVGAVFCAPALRRWICRTRVQALLQALGPSFVQALLQEPDRARDASLPAELPDWPLSEPSPQDPAAVAELLRSCGAAVLIGTLPHGALRHAASQALAPLAELMMPAAHAQALLQRAQALAQALTLTLPLPDSPGDSR